MQRIDITSQAIEAGHCSARLQMLGFRVWQAVDEQGADVAQYIDPPLCDVPAGPFLMGSDQSIDAEALEEELPQHSVTLAAFQIGKYPVTAAEYAYAVRARRAKKPPTDNYYRTWNMQLERLDHPVVNVDWYNAMKYAAWLSQLTGKTWGLATEAQWEKAARGTDGRIYPWGDEWNAALANTLGGSIPLLITTPIGEHPPESTSPYGAFDMAGNVWEWTRSTSADYPYDATDGREYRKAREAIRPQYGSEFDEELGGTVWFPINDAKGMMARGGCFDDIYEEARAASRKGVLPDSERGSIGFRLVLNEFSQGIA
ncbi:MAG TPA: formylglycine-generating enzyme family protein [Ktedonobacterales bacterium]|nr:formylglycine-generating enzyme family protein [Ktedonobacterales bacterium]